MRRLFMLSLLAGMALCTGCDRRHKLADFPFKPGLTMEQLESEIGSPSKRDAHWVAYDLDDGNEVRVFFLAGEKNGTRALSVADVYTKEGVRVKTVYKLPRAQPASNPAVVPATQPIN